jgi:hypothetical protein
VAATLSIARTAANVDTANVHVEIVDASDNNLVYATFKSGRQIILAGDVRVNTYSFARKIPRKDFKVLVTNSSADTVTMYQNTLVRSEIEVMGW